LNQLGRLESEWQNFAKMSLTSCPSIPPASLSNDPDQMPSMSENMLSQATRAIGPSMLMRRTPTSVSSAKLKPSRIMTTLTGFGATARTIDAISPSHARRGAQAVRTALANATSLSIDGNVVGLPVSAPDRLSQNSAL
jgi:hypothetical protein